MRDSAGITPDFLARSVDSAIIGARARRPCRRVVRGGLLVAGATSDAGKSLVVEEMGVIEPLVVARSPEQPGRYLLLDGHLRHAVLTDSGETVARCLIAHDDEAFTYNKRINRLATIVRPIKRRSA